MNITEADKQTVLDALASNPRASTHPMSYAELLEKTGFTRRKLNAAKAILVTDGRIWESHEDETGKRTIYLIVSDKRQQILDLIKVGQSPKSVRFWPETSMFVKYCQIPKQHVHHLIVGLVVDGILQIDNIRVAPSASFLTEIEAEQQASAKDH